MDAFYAVQAQYVQELQSLRLGLDILDAGPDPQFYLPGAVQLGYEDPLAHECALQELLCPPRPKKNEVDQDSQSPLYKTDEFRMFHFKVHDCTKQYSHCYKHCPFAHKNEYAKRRSPKLQAYSCIMCPDQDALNNGKTSNSRGYASKCHRGDVCAYSHSNLERHLHPDMYRTERCNAFSCQKPKSQAQTRPVCFFAHSNQELRTVDTFAVPLDCLEPFMFTPGTREYELAGRSSFDVAQVDLGVFQRIAANKLASRARARKARAQLDAEGLRLKADAEQRMKALWNPWLGTSAGLGATAFPKLNLLDFASNTAECEPGPLAEYGERIPARRVTAQAQGPLAGNTHFIDTRNN